MRILSVVVLTLLCFVTQVRGVDVQPEVEQFWSEAQEYGVEEGSTLEEGLTALLAEVPEVLKQLLTAGMRTAVQVLAVVLVCAIGQGMEMVGTSSPIPATRLAGALAVTALTMTDVSSMIGLGRDTMQRMDTLSTVLLPAMAVLTALSGHVTAAAVRQGATVLFSKLLVTVMDELLVPLVYGYVAASCAQAAVGNPGLEKLAHGIKSVVTGILNAMLIAFVGYLTASGAIAGSVDMSRIRAAKMAISRAIPVVGGILADASETVLAGAGALRGVVGGAGLVVVLAICLTPFLHLGVQYILYKATAVLCGAIAQPELAKLIDAIGSAFGLILGMTGAAALILMVSVVSAILVVTG